MSGAKPAKRFGVVFSVVLTGLMLAACASTAPQRFTGDYLGFDEQRAFRVDDDESFSFSRPEKLMKYWQLSAVKDADLACFQKARAGMLFPAVKGPWLYFSVAYDYEHYVDGPVPENPDLVATIAKYWVQGLNRYRIPRAEIPTGPKRAVGSRQRR